MEDWLKCKISPLIKYRQNQSQISFIRTDRRTNIH